MIRKQTHFIDPSATQEYHVYPDSPIMSTHAGDIDRLRACKICQHQIDQRHDEALKQNWGMYGFE